MNQIEQMESLYEWKDIEGYEGLYQVSEYGDVMSIGYGKKRLLKAYKSSNDYLCVALHQNGTRKQCLVHRLVATAFCERAEGFNIVNHLDENKLNNHYSNLEWCSYEYNNNYGTRNDRIKKQVKCIELDMVYDSVAEAAEYTGAYTSNISACCRGRYKTAGGYHWEYVD